MNWLVDILSGEVFLKTRPNGVLIVVSVFANISACLSKSTTSISVF
jgi:hypothetical protein